MIDLDVLFSSLRSWHASAGISVDAAVEGSAEFGYMFGVLDTLADVGLLAEADLADWRSRVHQVNNDFYRAVNPRAFAARQFRARRGLARRPLSRYGAAAAFLYCKHHEFACVGRWWIYTQEKAA